MLNQETHRMLKAIAAKNGRTLSSVLEEIAMDYIKDQGKL